MDKVELTVWLKGRAEELGFCLAGACPAVAPDGYHRFLDWLDRGYSGEMRYLPDRSEAYRHPGSVLPGVVSLLMLGLSYRTGDRVKPDIGQGSIASYAWGSVDYHDLIHGRLKELKASLQERVPDVQARGVVDTAPLLEREFAQLSGLGWVGKNTLLLNRAQGSYFFLAALLMDAELDYDEPFAKDHCGTCTACLDHCPTDAFPQPYVLDARRCISYLTIEHRGPIPDQLRGTWNDWLFGCDICQEVCPWNQRVTPTETTDFDATVDSNPVDLAALFYLDDVQFRERFRYTPLWRSKRRGILRNAALLLGTQRAASAVDALEQGCCDADALVQAASEWALARIRDIPDPPDEP